MKRSFIRLPHHHSNICHFPHQVNTSYRLRWPLKVCQVWSPIHREALPDGNGSMQLCQHLRCAASHIGTSSSFVPIKDLVRDTRSARISHSYRFLLTLPLRLRALSSYSCTNFHQPRSPLRLSTQTPICLNELSPSLRTFVLSRLAEHPRLRVRDYRLQWTMRGLIAR